jgi:hypothetical protein
MTNDNNSCGPVLHAPCEELGYKLILDTVGWGVTDGIQSINPRCMCMWFNVYCLRRAVIRASILPACACAAIYIA